MIAVLAITCLAPIAIYLATRSLASILALLLITTVLGRSVVRLTGIAQLEFLDDALVLLYLMRTLLHGRGHITRMPGGKFFAAFFAFGLVSALANGVPVGILASGSFLATKAVIVGWCATQTPFTIAGIRQFVRFVEVLLIAVIVGSIANLIAPQAWASAIAVNGGVIDRYGLPSVTSIFVHPFDLAFFCSVAALTVVTISERSSKSWLVVGAFAAVALSFRRKELIGLILAQYFALGGATAKARRFFFGASVATLVILASSFIITQASLLSESYVSLDSGEARTQLTIGSARVASDHFPLGAGFGRYGSRTAAENYSPEYINLGFERVYGLGSSEESGQFLTDTAWPAVIGEAGFLGGIAFLIGLLQMMRFALLSSRDGSSHLSRSLGRLAGAIIILVLVESLGAAVFSSPPVYPVAFGVVGALVSIRNSEGAVAISEGGVSA